MIGTITKKENETNLLCVKSMSEYQETLPPKHTTNTEGGREKSVGGESRGRENNREGGSTRTAKSATVEKHSVQTLMAE